MKSILFDHIEHPYFSYEEAVKAELFIGCGPLSEKAFSDYLDATEEPDLEAFLSHQLDQIEGAKAAKAFDSRWRNLEHCTGEALIAVDEGNIARIAAAFCELGRAIEEMHHPTREQLVEYHDLYLDQLCRVQGFANKADKFRSAKNRIQAEALELWNNDKDQELKTGYVAGLLHELAKELTQNAITGGEELKLETVKSWLREIAPEYAGKGGRPRKPKK
ncbi:hypothetical protein [Marinobacter sp. MBR-105]